MVKLLFLLMVDDDDDNKGIDLVLIERTSNNVIKFAPK